MTLYSHLKLWWFRKRIRVQTQKVFLLYYFSGKQILLFDFLELQIIIIWYMNFVKIFFYKYIFIRSGNPISSLEWKVFTFIGINFLLNQWQWFGALYLYPTYQQEDNTILSIMNHLSSEKENFLVVVLWRYALCFTHQRKMFFLYPTWIISPLKRRSLPCEVHIWNDMIELFSSEFMLSLLFQNINCYKIEDKYKYGDLFLWTDLSYRG